MTNEELIKRVELIEYHLSILSDCVDYEKYPVETLILSLGWSEEQINKAHDIFQKYDELLENKEKIDWNDLENDLENELSIGYQTVKRIVLAFFENNQWVEVCLWFVSSQEHPPAEYRQILRNIPDSPW